MFTVFPTTSWQSQENLYIGLRTSSVIKVFNFLRGALILQITFDLWIVPLTTVLRIYAFDPKSDQHLISPYNIISKSNRKVKRMEKMITN